MESYLYTCNYCGKEYKPARRRIQKYCSNSCRVRAYHLKKRKVVANSSSISAPSNEFERQKNKVEAMSWAGVGNAAAGTLAVNALSSLFMSEENKPVTKKDFKEIKELFFNRYYPIKNMASDAHGNDPHYDIETKSIVYLKSVSHGK